MGDSKNSAIVGRSRSTPSSIRFVSQRHGDTKDASGFGVAGTSSQFRAAVDQDLDADVLHHPRFSTDGLEFLGYQFLGYSGQMRVSPKNLDKFKRRVRELTRRSCGISMTTRLKALGYYLRGWTGYFCLVPIKSFFVVLDKWVRRRLRACYWKQWRKPSARIRNLMKLGLARNEAVPFGSCSRGVWFMSHCESVQSTLTNAYLATTGLVSLSEVWSKLAPKR